MMRLWQDEIKYGRYQALIKPALIICVILLSVLLGLRASPSLLILVGIGFGGIITLIVLKRHPVWGVIALVPVSMLIKYEIGTGTNVSLNGSIVLAVTLIGVWLFNMIASNQHVSLVPSRINRPAIIFIIVSTLSLIAGNIQWIPQAWQSASVPAQVGGLLLLILPVGVMLLVGNQVKELKWVRIITWSFLLIGGVYVIGNIVPLLNSVVSQVYLSPRVTYNPFGSVFWIFIVVIPFALILFKRMRLYWYLFLISIIFCAIYYSWFSNLDWISGWLPMIVALFVIVWLRSWRWGLTLTIIGGLIVWSNYSSLNSMIMTSTQQYSTISRAATWPIMTELIKAGPILGLGPSQYYHYTPLYPLLGWYVKFNSHNNYIDIIAQTGLLGMGVFLWLVVEIGWLGWRLRDRVQDGFSRAYVNGVLAGLVAMLIAGFMGDWFLPFLYNIGFPGFRSAIIAWIFIGGLIAIEQVVKNNERIPIDKTAGDM
jgi:O-antigen ligase